MWIHKFPLSLGLSLTSLHFSPSLPPSVPVQLLCIDEATASVDQKTDKLLQQTIRETFRNQTVLTIAHRWDLSAAAPDCIFAFDVFFFFFKCIFSFYFVCFCPPAPRATRINTIMDCDRVLVMQAGKVVEFDTPAALCRTDRSVFQRLAG